MVQWMLSLLIARATCMVLRDEMSRYLRDGVWRERCPLIDDAAERHVIGFIDYAVHDHDAVVGDVVIPRVIDVEVPGDGHVPSLAMCIEVVAGVPQCRMLKIESTDSGREVSGHDLASVNVTRWVDAIVAITAVDVIGTDADPVRRLNRPTDDQAANIAFQRARQPRRVTLAVLAKVADVYRANLDGNPVQAVSRSFGVGNSAAAAYVLRARKSGLLPPTTPGKKKG